MKKIVYVRYCNICDMACTPSKRCDCCMNPEEWSYEINEYVNDLEQKRGV